MQLIAYLQFNFNPMVNENIDLMFEIETSSIIEAVEKRWRKFQHDDLDNLSRSLNAILLRERKGEVLISQSEQPQYFENTLQRKNEELGDIMNKRRCPIPSWFLENSNTPGVISILPIDISITLAKSDTYFNEFCAFRLATINTETLAEFMRYLFLNSFKSNTVEFSRAMRFILADFETVLPAKKILAVEETLDLEYSIVKSNSEHVEMTTLVDSKSSFEVLQSPQNDHSQVIAKNKQDAFTEIEIRLLKLNFINASYEWQKEKIKLVAFIQVLYRNKFLKQICLKEDKTMRPLVRHFFEKRYSLNIDDAFKPSNLSPNLFNKHRIDFTFVEAIES